MDGARTYLRNGLAQSDLDMDHHKLLNLDTSNLPPSGIPPTLVPARSQWVDGWDSPSRQWHTSQPRFSDISGLLTNPQQVGITALGTIRVGVWQATTIDPTYLPKLNNITIPDNNVNLNNKKVINLADPLNPGDAVNLRFMDSLLQGLNPKQAVRAASTTNIVKAGLQTVDGVPLNVNDRVLIKDNGPDPAFHGPATDNGIWLAKTGSWIRATDCDHGSLDGGVNKGNDVNDAYVVVLEGTQNGGTGWVSSLAVNHINVSLIGFFQFSTAAHVNAGDGLTLDGNTLNVGAGPGIQVNADSIQIDPSYVGQGSIHIVGAIDTGTWQGDILAPEFGGTGINNAHTITLDQVNLTIAKNDLAVPEADLRFEVLSGATTISFPHTGTVATLTGAETLTNKRITKRAIKTATSSAPAINTDVVDSYTITALATNISSFTTNLTGIPSHGDELTIWLHDNGADVGHTLNFGAAFADSPSPSLPTHTTSTGWTYLRFVYNSELSKWCLTVKVESIA